MNGSAGDHDAARFTAVGADSTVPDTAHGAIAALCRDVTGATATDGAAVTILSTDGARELVYASNALAQILDEIQFTAGVGPCVDAFVSGEPVLCDDLTAVSTDRWFGFVDEAAAAGARGVFAFPLQGGDVVFGVLELYRAHPGPLTAEARATAHDAATLVATAALTAFVMSQGADGGVRAAERGLVESEFSRPQVNQAAGMVSVQVNSTVGDALARMRARAYTEHRSLSELADDVVNRRIRFSDDVDGDTSDPGGGSTE